MAQKKKGGKMVGKIVKTAVSGVLCIALAGGIVAANVLIPPNASSVQSILGLKSGGIDNSKAKTEGINMEYSKPGFDTEEALGMLRLLSGRTHEVVTVLSVCKGSQLESEAVVTKVTFRTLCEEELRAYVRTGEPMDKAGSYGIQGYGAMFVKCIEGDYFSVMGLPLCPLCRMLRAFGVPILDVQEAQA